MPCLSRPAVALDPVEGAGLVQAPLDAAPPGAPPEMWLHLAVCRGTGGLWTRRWWTVRLLACHYRYDDAVESLDRVIPREAGYASA